MGNDIKQPVQFDVLRVNRGRKKLCQCNNPHYEVNPLNRIVMCVDCGAVVDALEALVTICKQYERIHADMERLRAKTSVYADETEKAYKRMLRNRAFQGMAESCKNNMMPICPECGKPFEPEEIVSWINRKHLEENV